jgi:hypothetical protein
MPKKKTLPAFANEAAEAQWYAEHQDELDAYMTPVKPQSTPLWQRLGLAPREEETPAKQITIRIPPADIERAKIIASRKGLRYQTYLKMLIHEGVERDERDSAAG